MSLAESPGGDRLYLQDQTLGSGICLRLPVFEGPMDLLLFLIRREEIDVFNIPIALLTREYLRSLELMRALDLDVGGEFLAMAATLLHIKARMLLPRPVKEFATEEDDPRRDLVERLLEYKAFKESAEVFRVWESAQSERFCRSPQEVPEGNDAEEVLRNVTLFDLLQAFKRAMDRFKEEQPGYNVFMQPETMDQRMEFLRSRLQDHKRVSFQLIALELETRLAVIITFLAILEMVRLGEILLRGMAGDDFYLQAKKAA
ncbi:MAG: hypothetical protein C4524_13130 [Candidatus Zixiibacteriota bacterium]|nr:MAG: hypothetical protein C4524_13130 [candidate division Zixibacteria bacterium]